MSVVLEIHDGVPHWYLSPDIWTVPNDPLGAPALPIENLPCYLYARVSNNGTTNVLNATVKFYWANPAVGFNRMTANFIGQSNVSLTAGQTDDVLCLVPWMPSFVNNGHQCILAEVFHASDPLPATLDFNVPTDRHVAQRNLSVISAKAKMFMLVFEVHNKERKEGVFELMLEQGQLASLKEIAPHLGKDTLLNLQDGRLGKTAIYDSICPNLMQLDKEK